MTVRWKFIPVTDSWLVFWVEKKLWTGYQYLLIISECEHGLETDWKKGDACNSLLSSTAFLYRIYKTGGTGFLLTGWIWHFALS